MVKPALATCKQHITEQTVNVVNCCVQIILAASVANIIAAPMWTRHRRCFKTCARTGVPNTVFISDTLPNELQSCCQLLCPDNIGSIHISKHCCKPPCVCVAKCLQQMFEHTCGREYRVIAVVNMFGTLLNPASKQLTKYCLCHLKRWKIRLG